MFNDVAGSQAGQIATTTRHHPQLNNRHVSERCAHIANPKFGSVFSTTPPQSVKHHRGAVANSARSPRKARCTRPGLQPYFGGATPCGVRADDQKVALYAPWCGVRTWLRAAGIASFRRIWAASDNMA